MKNLFTSDFTNFTQILEKLLKIDKNNIFKVLSTQGKQYLKN